MEKYGITFLEEGRIQIRKNRTVRVWQLPAFPLSQGTAAAMGRPVCTEYSLGNLEVLEAVYALTNSPAELIVTVQVRPDTSFLRMHYTLKGIDTFCGTDADYSKIRTESVHPSPIFYGGMNLQLTALTELQISQFDRILHSFVPAMYSYFPGEFEGTAMIGPILVAEDADGCVLAAYEHGAQAPDHFLEWNVDADRIRLYSVKGNYYNGQSVEEYAAPWIELGFSEIQDTLFREYRQFMLEDMALYGDSRKPYIFFNTWHNQEGKKYFIGDSYLKYMNEEFILKDIEIAHAMGIEVYVIDTGWFSKTGDWKVNLDFFPSGMKTIKERLDAYGMRLGLWFNPIAAARTSHIYQEHPECVMSWQGQETYWGKIWETEESYGMCLVSDYSDMFIEQLVECYQRLGVTYFKWDAVGQYGCDCPGHKHGTQSNIPLERADAYAYRMGLEMIRIATEVSRRCPGTIVDFDITEGNRFVGLGFLAAGKYFLINNGPYFHNFDIPSTVKMEPDTINVFFYPGAARPQICRQSVRFDSYIPSVLFLTHFFPHGNVLGQKNSMAALALGGNGIWGFLQEMSQEDIARWAIFLKKYKEVREDLTLAYPLYKGNQGSSPEIYEKINPLTGRGAVIFFTHGKGDFIYTTQPLQALPQTIDGADKWEEITGKRIRIHLHLAEDEARVVFLF